MLVNAKIKRYVSYSEYADDSFIELFKEAGIKFERRKKPSSKVNFLD
jgi:dCMP deaminase